MLMRFKFHMISINKISSLVKVANEIQIPHDKHHKVSSLVKSHQNTHNPIKYEVA